MFWLKFINISICYLCNVFLFKNVEKIKINVKNVKCDKNKSV